MNYDLEYHKNLDKSHILPNILKGAQMGIISQFLADIILQNHHICQQLFWRLPWQRRCSAFKHRINE